MTDIEITKKFIKKPISEVAKTLRLVEDELEFYGKYKAKVKTSKEGPYGKLILVTAVSPSPYGEGKTTVSIGLGDALCDLGKKACMVLREPSLGPVFGMKGGATGGGYAQVVPMEDINLHFTGDFHAITAANNLLSAAIDNHLFQGNALDLDPSTIVFKRCLDVNDRALREVSLGNRQDHFTITAASELMTIFCLSESLEDLRRRIGQILIGYTSFGQAIYAKDLQVEGAMTVLLKDAFAPNLVQTLENHPVLIHGGPFANIAHGCNSIVATKLGLQLADYVVTEAGFGADLGAEKFFDIKCRKAGLVPDAVVLVVTTKALKYNAGIGKEELLKENCKAIETGICNLKAHIENLRKYGVPFVVALNRYKTDTDREVETIENFCQQQDVPFSCTTSYSEGGKGSFELAKKVLNLTEMENHFQFLYEDTLSIQEKIEKIAKEIYHAKEVIYTENAEYALQKIETLSVKNYPICIAKTQYSFSDDAKKLGDPRDYSVTVREVQLYNGAEFIAVLLNDIMTMPGLSKKPNYEKIDLDDQNEIVGIF